MAASVAPAWRPDPTGLEHVVGMLRASTEGTEDQASVYARLQAYATRSDFNSYLAYILAHGAAASAGSETVRQAAGLLLKNNLKTLYKSLAPEIRAYINTELLSAIGDDSRLVRGAVAVCITAIVSKAGLQVWPDLFPTLVSCLDSQHDAFLDGALNALCRICEDAPDLLDEDPSQPLDVIIPKLLSFFQHPNDAVRIKVVHILNQFLLVMPPALSDNIDAYLAALFRVAEDASFEVRKRVCSAICMLHETRPDTLAPHMSNILSYMVHASGDDSNVVALEACEFWSTYAPSPSAAPTMRHSLPRLIPVLLGNIVYSEDDVAFFDAAQEDDDMVPDKPQDIRPRFHSSRFMSSVGSQGSSEGPLAPTSSPLSSSPNPPQAVSPVMNVSGISVPGNGTGYGNGIGNAGNGESSAATGPNTASSLSALVSSGSYFSLGQGLAGNPPFSGHRTREEQISLQKLNNRDTVSENLAPNALPSLPTKNGGVTTDGGVGSDAADSDGEDDEDDEDGLDSEWTLRKCSAAALDCLSSVYGAEILPLLLPRLQELLTNTERWEQREAGVLALGAIAVGCYEGISPHLETLFPFLLSLLTDSHHRVRVMSCWTLSRYAKWILESKDASKLEQTLRALTDRMLDRNKTVQKSSCSALASLEEQAGVALIPYVAPILQTFSSAACRYQDNNFVALLDTLCTLVDAVGRELGSEVHVNVLMPPLISRWNSLSDDDFALIPVFECLTRLLRVIGPASHSIAVPIFTRCVNVVESTYARELAGVPDDGNRELLACSLDLMSSISVVVGPRLDPLLVAPANGRGNMIQLLFMAMKDGREDVRMSAFALVGELSRSGMPSLIPVLADYIGAIVGGLNPEYMRCATNATWALGELVMMAGFLPSSVPVDRTAIQKPLLDVAIPSLIRVVNISRIHQVLVENTAVTLGRLGLVMPDVLAPRLETFAGGMLAAVIGIIDDNDKEHAFSGMNALIKLNPSGFMPFFCLYSDAVANWMHVPPKLEEEFGSILVGFKTSLGDQWPALFSRCPLDLRNCLSIRFSL